MTLVHTGVGNVGNLEDLTAVYRPYTGKIYVTDHAKAEAAKDFRIPADQAEEWIKSNVKKASYVANIIGENGNPSRLFAYQGAAFILSPDVDRVITVYPQQTPYGPIKARVIAVAKRELKRAERKRTVVERNVNVNKAKLAVELAKCHYNMTVTPSAAVKRANTKRIEAIQSEMAALDQRLFTARREFSAVAKDVVAYL